MLLILPIMLYCSAKKFLPIMLIIMNKKFATSNVLLLSMDNDKLWLMNNWLDVKCYCCALTEDLAAL